MDLGVDFRDGDVIFVDFDGTLVNTDACNTKAYTAAIENVLGVVGVELFDVPRIERVVLQERLPWITDELQSRIIVSKEEFYGQFMNDIELIHPTMNIIEQYATTHRVCLVTNARRNRVMQTLSHFGLKDTFDTIITRDDCNGCDKFTAAISRLNLNPERVWVLENEKEQVELAVKAGIDIKHIIIIKV